MARPRTDIRERIVPSARQEFLAHGVDGASLRTIAKQAGTSLGMIYYYYPSKDELFLAVIEGPYQSFLERLEGGLESAGTFEERLRRLFGVVSELNELERSTLRLVVREMLGSKERLTKAIERFQRGHFPLLFALLQNGVREGKIAPGYHPAVLLGLIGGIGVVPQIILEVTGPSLPFPAPPTEQLTQTLAQAFIRAVSTPPAKFAEK
jgi:AcrR family transcriptional regulator